MKKIFRSVALILIIMLVVSFATPTEVSAASYPVVATTLRTSVTIPEGETGKIQLMVFPKYKNEKYHIEVYNSAGKKIAQAENQYYNSGVVVRYFDISINTATLDMGVGTYTIKYWTSFYSFYEWHNSPSVYSCTLKVIKNVCKGNHNFNGKTVVIEGSCKEEGTVRKSCSKCGHILYEDEYGAHTYGSWTKLNDSSHQRECTLCGKTESAAHNWNSGAITKQPNCAATGVKTYTCNTCGGTKTETLAKTNNHSYGSWVQLDGTSHQHECTLCGKTENATHSWNSGTVTKQPNCAATGVKTYTCNACTGTKTETLAKTTDHCYGIGLKIDGESHWHSCTVCGNEETVAHKWDSGKIILMPTLETTGLRELSCKGCDAVKTEIVPKRASGDLNGDQNIDNKDVEYLLWNTLFPERYPLETFADFASDGVVDNKDVEYLLWHTLFPDRYPLEIK